MKSQKSFVSFKNSEFLRGFTLIELLVVVSIIGLLTSVVIVAVKGARDKAKTAAALQFSASIKHVLGAYLIGEWNFDNDSSSTVKDVSGNGNNGTIITGSVNYPAGVVNKAIYSSDRAIILVPYNDRGINSGAITIESWVKLDININDFLIASKRDASYVYWPFYFNLYPSPDPPGGLINFGVTDVNEAECNLLVRYPMPPGQWIHFAASYNGTNTAKVFANGKEVSSRSDCSIVMYKPAPAFLELGGSAHGYIGLRGSLDELRIYDAGLTSAQVQQLYAESLPRHKNIAEK